MSEVPHGQRRRLPTKSKGYRVEAIVGGHKIVLHTAEYEDGMLGEIAIDMQKEGASFRAMMQQFAAAVSLALQYGAPLEELIELFMYTRFEPSGMVMNHPEIANVTSVVDFIFRELAIHYCGRQDLVAIAPVKRGTDTKVIPLPVALGEPGEGDGEFADES